MSNSSRRLDEQPPFRYRIRASAGGKVKIKFAESFSTELDDDSLLPEDSDDYHQELVKFGVQETSTSFSPTYYLLKKNNDQQQKVLNINKIENINYDNNNDDYDDYDERRRLMSSSEKNIESQNCLNNKRSIEDNKGNNKFFATGSTQLPSTINYDTNYNDDELIVQEQTNDTQKIFPQYPLYNSGGSIVKMRTDTSYAVRNSGASINSDCAQFPSSLKPIPRMGRRFTLNPLIFAKEERDARRQSLAQLKLSYYPNNANPDIYDAGLGICSWSLMCLSWLFLLLTFPISVCFCIKVVQEYERAVIFRLGRLIGGGARGPGIFFVMPCIESYSKVDLRTVSFSVPPQEILTRDSVTVSVDAVVYYRVCNATVSVANVENAHHSTRLLAQTTLRNMLGTRNLSEILSDRDNIATAMQTLLDEATESWGIKVERVEIKDVRLPVQLQRAMAAEAEATREARAKVIAAEGEQKASKSLRDAANVIATSPAAIQLRYLQTLNSVAAEKNSTIIFPLPMELIRNWIGTNNNDKNEKLS